MNTPAAGAARPPRGAPPPFRDDGAVTLAWLRRLDWRFLLPPREPRRVAYLGPERDSLLLALGEHGPTPRVVRRGGLAGRGCFDLVVAQSPGPDDLERAAALVADGGSLYCELPRRGRATLLRRVRDLGAAGFGAPALYWHHPGFEDGRWIVPLGTPGATIHLLGRAGRLPARAARTLGGLLSGSGLAARWAPCVSLVLHRGRDGARPAAAPERLACVLFTPRFRTSAHVVAMLVDESTGEPVLVAKAARRPGPAPALEREAANLRAVHDARPGGFDSVPRLRGLREHAGRRVLLETALGGRLLRAADARRSPTLVSEAVLAWTVEVHAATARRDVPAGSAYDRGIARPLARLADAWPLSPEERALVAATLDEARPLADHPLPTVMCHGDLAAPNLLLGSDGRLQVVDWELADPEGLPGEDLFFALAWAALPRGGSGAGLAAFHGAFFGPDAWATPYVARYAAHLSLPPGVLRPLFVAGWARYLAARAERLRGGSAGPLPADAVAWLRADRHFHYWRHAVRHAAELRLAPDRP